MYRNKLEEQEADRIMAPFRLDMVAYFKLLEEEILKIVSQAKREGKTPEEIEQMIGELF